MEGGRELRVCTGPPFSAAHSRERRLSYQFARLRVTESEPSQRDSAMIRILRVGRPVSDGASGSDRVDSTRRA